MRKYFLLYGLVFITLVAKSQLYQSLSQPYMGGQYINPAYAGSREVFSVTLMARQQWTGLEGAPKTMNFGFHTPLKKLNLAAGFVAFNDKIGVSRFSGLAVNYVYRIRIKDGKRNLALGLKTGITSFKADLSQLKLNESSDPAFNGVVFSLTKFDAGFGVYYYTPHFYVSYSIPLISSFGYNSLQTFDSINTKATTSYFFSGFIFKIGKDVQLHPSLFFKAIKNDGQIDLNLSVIVMNTLSMGISVRSADALVFSLEYQINKQLRLGYAHDFTTSPLQKVTSGSNEIVIRYELIKQFNVYSTRFF
ncbi:MAG TPA: type IX secretion system membrane protein PorP/SprF [Bacteroidales bacterium]|nr:type IX secretion system membrane protein PorP/SprF [Bacteroidales bacterium]